MRARSAERERIFRDQRSQVLVRNEYDAERGAKSGVVPWRTLWALCQLSQGRVLHRLRHSLRYYSSLVRKRRVLPAMAAHLRSTALVLNRPDRAGEQRDAPAIDREPRAARFDADRPPAGCVTEACHAGFLLADEGSLGGHAPRGIAVAGGSARAQRLTRTCCTRKRAGPS